MNHKKIIKKIKKATLDRPLEIWFLYRQRKKKELLGFIPSAIFWVLCKEQSERA